VGKLSIELTYDSGISSFNPQVPLNTPSPSMLDLAPRIIFKPLPSSHNLNFLFDLAKHS
jgi:hypothetical protein